MRIDGRFADILFCKSQYDEKVLIEVVVESPCDVRKIQIGPRILGIYITHESKIRNFRDEIENLIRDLKIQTSKRCYRSSLDVRALAEWRQCGSEAVDLYNCLSPREGDVIRKMLFVP